MILKKGASKWKPVAAEKTPKKVKTDLKHKPKSSLRVSGDVNTFFTQPASCTRSGGLLLRQPVRPRRPTSI